MTAVCMVWASIPISGQKFMPNIKQTRFTCSGAPAGNTILCRSPSRSAQRPVHHSLRVVWRSRARKCESLNSRPVNELAPSDSLFWQLSPSSTFPLTVLRYGAALTNLLRFPRDLFRENSAGPGWEPDVDKVRQNLRLGSAEFGSWFMVAAVRSEFRSRSEPGRNQDSFTSDRSALRGRGAAGA
jgi:hypothetical protein